MQVFERPATLITECRRWPRKVCYATADAASIALRLMWTHFQDAGRYFDPTTSAYRCPGADPPHWHLGRGNVN